MDQNRRENFYSLLVGFGVTLSIFGLLSGTTRFWKVDLNTVGIAGKWFILPGLLALAYGYIKFRKLNLPLTPLVNPFGAALVLPLLFLVDFLSRGYGFFPPDSYRGELIVCGFLLAWLCRNSFSLLYKFSLPMTVFLCVIAFWIQSNGKLLLFDDHASFFYRLQMLKDNFPLIPHYNPLWNGGIDSRDYFPTGVLNVFLIFAPLIYLFPLENLYNLIIAIIFFGMVPTSLYFTARFLGRDRNEGLLASVVALTSSILWYRWGLKYGALGFCVSAILLPLNCSILIRLLDEEFELSFKQACLLIISLLLMGFWSLSAIAFVPLLLILARNFKKLIQKKHIVFVLTVFFAVYIPWSAIFVTASKVGSFISLSPPTTQIDSLKSPNEPEIDLSNPWAGKMASLVVRAKNEDISLKSILKHLRDVTIMTNPLILLLSLPGCFLLTRKYRTIIFAMVGWNLFLAIIVSAWKPQLELDRMYLLALFILTVPTAASLKYIFEKSLRGDLILKLAGLAVASFFVFSVFASTAIVHSRREEQYFFTDDSFFRVGSAIKSESKGGRAVFPGFILHDLARAHIAPLIFTSQTPIVASYPFHQVWWYTEQVPDYYLQKGVEGVEQYFDLMNADVLVVREPKWIQFVNDNPGYYLFRRMENNFLIYIRLRPSLSYFAEGQGELISQDSNHLKIKMTSPAAIIKFNYLPFLQSDDCELSPVDYPGEVRLIQISDCSRPEPEITIKAASAISRVKAEIRRLLAL